MITVDLAGYDLDVSVSLALVTNRSSNTSPLAGLSITWLKKLSVRHLRNLLDHLQITATFPADAGVVEVPQEDKSLQA